MLSHSFGLRALEWLLTYGVHSTVLLGGAWFLTTRRFVRSERVRETIWKTAVVGGVLTALVQTGAGIEPFGGLSVKVMSVCQPPPTLPCSSGSLAMVSNSG